MSVRANSEGLCNEGESANSPGVRLIGWKEILRVLAYKERRSKP